MNYFLLFLGSAICFYFGQKQWKKNLADLKVKNASEAQQWKKIANGAYFMLWPSYLFTLATGLIVNNLIFK